MFNTDQDVKENRTPDPPQSHLNCNVMHFCQPDRTEEKAIDRKLLSSAYSFDVPFEGQVLKAYKWGEGKMILLVHGWGSRASHMAFLARYLANAGFSVVAYDCPGHGRSIYNNENVRTNLPEYCRSIYHMNTQFGPFYGIIGHSLGATASALTLSGQANLAGYKINAEKLVMISAPSGVRSMVTHFCNKQGLEEDAHHNMVELLEAEFPLKVRDYEIKDALSRIPSDILVVHDKEDEEIEIEEARIMVQGHEQVQFLETSGEGHRKILISRELFRSVKGFL